MEDQTVLKLWSIGQSYYSDVDNGNVDDTIGDMRKVIEQYVDDLHALGDFDGRNCSLMGEPGGVEYNWNTFGTVLFATTVFTTVGTIGIV